MSDLEEYIMLLLNKGHIKFEREKIFSDLRKGRYRFDFYCPYVDGGSVIEVQGPQHYEQIKHFQKTRRDFMAAQERDRRKISYCLSNGIKIYCIPYWEVKEIKTAKEIFSDKFLARNKWKNDDDWRNFQGQN